MIAMAIAAGALGVPLWQEVRAGMSFEELKAVRPHARPIPRALAGRYVIPCTHMDDDVLVVGYSFRVCNAIGPRGVRDVALYLDNLKYGSPLESLKTLLVGRYGRPELDECKETSLGRDCDLVFRHNGVRIRAANLYFSLDETNATSIHYETVEDDGLPL